MWGCWARGKRHEELSGGCWARGRGVESFGGALGSRGGCGGVAEGVGAHYGVSGGGGRLLKTSYRRSVRAELVPPFPFGLKTSSNGFGLGVLFVLNLRSGSSGGLLPPRPASYLRGTNLGGGHSATTWLLTPALRKRGAGGETKPPKKRRFPLQNLAIW